MPITQVLLTASASAAPPPPPPPSPDGLYYINESTVGWGSVGVGQNKPSYNASFSYADNVTVAPIWDFNGSDQFMTTQLTNGFTQIYMNIWFYPTSAGRILATFQDNLIENNGYHHAALIINANSTVSGRFWANGFFTTDNTVNLYQWNHIYFRHTGSQALIQLNGGTAVTQNSVWSMPAPLVVGIGTTSATNNGISARFQGSIAELRMNSTNTVSNYSFTRSKYETPQQFIYDDFTIEWWQKAEAIGVNTRPWAIGLLNSSSGQEVSISYEGNGRDYVWLNNNFPGAMQYRPLKNHYGIGWEHMAMVRKDGTLKVYSNGTSYIDWPSGNQAITALNANLVIGTGELPNGNFQGYIKDFHVIKGYAKYTTNFSVPEAPVLPQTGSVFLLPVSSNVTVYNDTIGSKVGTLTNTPSYSSDNPYLFPTQTFTVFAYGGLNIALNSPYVEFPRVGLKVSDSSGWSDYVYSVDIPLHLTFYNNVPSRSAGEVYTIEQDVTSVTQVTNTYGGAGPVWSIDYSSTNFNVELLKVRIGWSVSDGVSTVGNVVAHAYLITSEVIRIGVNFDPETAVGLTFTYTAPAYGGSLRIDAGENIDYGPSVDFAFDVDAIATGNITLNLDANDISSYSGSGSTWTDLSGNNNATLIMTPYWDNGPPAYFEFNGINQYATVPGTNIIPAAAYTKMVWFRINTFSADNNLVSSDNGGHFMYFNQTTTLYAGHSNVFPYNAFGSTMTFSTNTWYCATVTFSVANGIKLYVNGALDASDPSFQTPHDQNGNTNIACFGVGGNLLNGRIGRLMCYGRELTAQEVLDNFNATRNRYGV